MIQVYLPNAFLSLSFSYIYCLFQSAVWLFKFRYFQRVPWAQKWAIAEEEEEEGEEEKVQRKSVKVRVKKRNICNFSFNWIKLYACCKNTFAFFFSLAIWYVVTYMLGLTKLTLAQVISNHIWSSNKVGWTKSVFEVPLDKVNMWIWRKKKNLL